PFIIQDTGLSPSASRHDLLLLLIENGLLDARGTLEALSPYQLRDVYYDRFDRVPTSARESTINHVLRSFGFEDRQAMSHISEPMKAKDSAGFQYDIALSFAGEDRPIASQIASALQARGVRVFT